MSKTSAKDSYYRTQGTWRILLNDNGNASHKINLEIVNPKGRPLEQYLRIDLPPWSNYTDFETTVNDQKLPEGDGYMSETRRIYISLQDIKGIDNQISTTISFEFNQVRAALEMGSWRLIVMPIVVRVKAENINLEIELPRFTRVNRVISKIVRLAERSSLYDVHDFGVGHLSLRPMEVDGEKGILKYALRDGNISLGFGFQSGFDRRSLVAVIVGFAAFVYSVITIIAEIL